MIPGKLGVYTPTEYVLGIHILWHNARNDALDSQPLGSVMYLLLSAPKLGRIFTYSMLKKRSTFHI